MRILITGGKGMLGRTLQRRFAGHDLRVADLPEVDVADPSSIGRAVAGFRPNVIIHGAAMTAVDACEMNNDAAFRVNALGSANTAVAAHRHRARLIAISTDYVFDGTLNRPYHEWDRPNPRTAYGASKLAGEEAVRAHCADHIIVRTAWLYGPGGPSFVHAILKQGAANEPAPIRVVRDQIGNPTSTSALADLIEILLGLPFAGTLHATCEGEASWHAFAEAIFEHRPTVRAVVACATAEYPRVAPRPANSRLEKRVLRMLGMPPMPHWREAVAKFLTLETVA